METERLLRFVERIRHLEAFLIYKHVDDRSVNEEDVVHEAKDRVVLKMSNGRVATGDAHADREQFPREYYIFMDGIEQLDVQLEASQTPVGNPRSEDPNSPSSGIK